MRSAPAACKDPALTAEAVVLEGRAELVRGPEVTRSAFAREKRSREELNKATVLIFSGANR
jgi:hypothetical protein